MTREQIKEQFPEATEEQITAILNIHGTEMTNAKKNVVPADELERLQEVDEAYKKLQEADLTDAEKVQKALSDAKRSEEEYNKKTARLEVEKIFVAAGLKEDNYKDVIDGIITTDAEKSKGLASSLVATIEAQTESAVKKTKEELMDGTRTPGGNGGTGGDEKTDAEKIAESLANSQKAANEATKSVLESYL